MENFTKPANYHGPGGALACGKLDVCGLWGNSWHCFGCGTLLFPIQNEAKRCSAASTSYRRLLRLGTANPDLQCLLPELGILRATSLPAAVQFLAGLSNFAWRTEYASAFFMLCLFSIPLFCCGSIDGIEQPGYPFATAPIPFGPRSRLSHSSSLHSFRGTISMPSSTSSSKVAGPGPPKRAAGIALFSSFFSRLLPITCLKHDSETYARVLSNTLRPSRCAPQERANQHPF